MHQEACITRRACFSTAQAESGGPLPPTGLVTGGPGNVGAPCFGGCSTARHPAVALLIAEALPTGQYRTLADVGYDLVPTVLAPVVEEFFLAQSLAQEHAKHWPYAPPSEHRRPVSVAVRIALCARRLRLPVRAELPGSRSPSVRCVER
jgi:hypothetical protein